MRHHPANIPLVKQHSLLKSSAIFQAAEICLTEVEERAKETELEELREKSDSQSQWLKSRIQRAWCSNTNFINLGYTTYLILKCEIIS